MPENAIYQVCSLPLKMLMFLFINISYICCFAANDDMRLPKVLMTDADTAGSISISTEAGPLKRSRSRHYLSGMYDKVCIMR